ncbi:hypothetical protein MHYP_G00273510 [Metynnis hypsauchen]
MPEDSELICRGARRFSLPADSGESALLRAGAVALRRVETRRSPPASLRGSDAASVGYRRCSQLENSARARCALRLNRYLHVVRWSTVF